MKKNVWEVCYNSHSLQPRPPLPSLCGITLLLLTFFDVCFSTSKLLLLVWVLICYDIARIHFFLFVRSPIPHHC